MSHDIVLNTEVHSIKDGARQQGIIKGVSDSNIRAMMRLIPGLGTDNFKFSDEVTEELNQGYMLAYNERHPAIEYSLVDKNWVRSCDITKKKDSVLEKFELSIFAAMSYTQQAYGGLKSTDPAKHELIGGLRSAFSKYASNCRKALLNEAKRLYRIDNNIQQTRGATLDFTDWLMTGGTNPAKAELAVIRQRAVNAKARGDTTVDLTKLDAAIAAFKLKMK